MNARRAWLASAGAMALGMALPACASAATAPADAHAHAAAAGASAPTGASGGGNAIVFNTHMLSGSSRYTADLSRLASGMQIVPGTYNVDVYLNQSWVGRMNMRFAAPSPDAEAVGCASSALLERMDLPRVQPQALARMQTPGACVAFSDLVPGGTLRLDMSRLRVDISVPQAWLGARPRGYVDPASWDAGVPAFRLNYRLNSYHTRSDGLDRTNAYLRLDAGLNIGLWHFRQHSTFSISSGSDGLPTRRRWHNIDAYVRRDLPGLRATLTLGDSYTDGAVFDSFGLRGVQLATDDRMLPQSRRGYAPVVRGVAHTNAQVTVRQNGVKIYQTTVPPGPFVIDDLYPTGFGGSIDVTVTEADGNQRTFSVPYASVAQLLRPGVTRFDVAAGRLRNRGLLDPPNVIQGTIQHGFNNVITGYAGFQGSSGYAAALLGVAFNTRLGALAVDVTEAGVTLPGHPAHTGQSVRLTWSKTLPRTDTSLHVAAYRYSTRGFLSLTDAVAARDHARRGLDTFQQQPDYARVIDGVRVRSPAQQAASINGTYAPGYAARGLLHRRSRFTLSMSQRLGKRGGALYANASFNDYWNRGGNDVQFQVGYNNHIGRLSYGLSVSRARGPFGQFDNRIFASFSLPLGSGPHTPQFALNLDHSKQGGMREQAMVNGTLGRWSQFNWGATASHDNRGSGYAGSVHAGYRSSYANFNASAGAGDGYSQASVAVSGAMVVHPGGVTFGRPIGNTVAIVHVPGAAGAHILNAPGVQVDGNGYAIVPYLQPYQRDTIRVDPVGLPLGVQLAATSANVAPYAGAVVMVDFKTRVGRTLIARIHQADGSAVPFGARILGADDHSIGVVGQGGMALLRGVDKAATMHAQWQGADSTAHACTFRYQRPSDTHHAPTGGYRSVAVTCTVPTTLAARGDAP